MTYLAISLIVMAVGSLLIEADPRSGRVVHIVGLIMVIVSSVLILFGISGTL